MRILLFVDIMDGMIGIYQRIYRIKKSLDKQLLTGLSTSGVSKSFLGSIFPFLYNDIKSLEKLLKKIKLE